MAKIDENKLQPVAVKSNAQKVYSKNSEDIMKKLDYCYKIPASQRRLFNPDDYTIDLEALKRIKSLGVPCWHCKHAWDISCSWAKTLTPVKGWVTIPLPKGHRVLGQQELQVDCPEYIPYHPQRRSPKEIKDLDLIGNLFPRNKEEEAKVERKRLKMSPIAFTRSELREKARRKAAEEAAKKKAEEEKKNR